MNLEDARSLLEEIYHTQGIDKQETGLALTSIDNIRRSCGYPHLRSSRDPWNSTAHQQPTTTAIQTELNSLRQDLDQKFTTLANLLNSNSNHTGPTYAAALMQNVTNLQSTTPNTLPLSLTYPARDNHPPKIRFLKLLNNPTTN